MSMNDTTTVEKVAADAAAYTGRLLEFTGTLVPLSVGDLASQVTWAETFAGELISVVESGPSFLVTLHVVAEHEWDSATGLGDGPTPFGQVTFSGEVELAFHGDARVLTGGLAPKWYRS